MSERKVLNKYYAPDFDNRFQNRPKRSKAKKEKPEDRQFHVRIMAPCNMRCNTCGEYIAKAKKFNSRQETVKGETYLGLRVYRFYIRCPRCMAEISFKTDLKAEDYELEQGATRNFQAHRFAEMQAEQETKKREQEEADNPMLALEKRTRESLQEMERLEALEELRDMSKRQTTLDHTELLKMNAGAALQQAQRAEDEDEAFVRSIFGRTADGKLVKRALKVKTDGKIGELDSSSSSDDSDEDIAASSTIKNKNVSSVRADTSHSSTTTRQSTSCVHSGPRTADDTDLFAKPRAVVDTLSSKTKSLKSLVRVVKKPQETTMPVQLPTMPLLNFRTSCSTSCTFEPRLELNGETDADSGLSSACVDEQNFSQNSQSKIKNSVIIAPVSIVGLANYAGSDDDSD